MKKIGQPEKANNTSFRVGNEFWKARTKHGRDKLFKEPAILWNACMEYFEWCNNNPLYAAEIVKFQGKGTIEPVPKMRAMSMTGMCIFLDISKDTWYEYKKYPDFTEICMRAEEVIYTQKFEGASADLLNPAIIARELGLVDKKEVEQKVNGGLNIVAPTEADAEIIKRLNDINATDTDNT